MTRRIQRFSLQVTTSVRTYLAELTDYLKDKKFGVINISKSGTTTETALAFRLLKKQCEDQLGKEAAKDVIVAITDEHKGAARAAATKEGYKTFIIPDKRWWSFLCAYSSRFVANRSRWLRVQKLVEGAQVMEKGDIC